MRVKILDHPLVTHKITVLRDRETTSPQFRQLVDELVTLLAYEATRKIRVEPKTVQTPVAQAEGSVIAKPRPLVVPILRAGLGMLEGMTRLIPTAEVGFLGMARHEKTLDIVTYAERLPDDLTGRQVYVLDPMLATGGTLIEAIKFLRNRGADQITCLCILGAPEGLAALERGVEGMENVDVFLAARDEKLDENAYIVPGLGDAGDRLYGVVD
ncbi:MULTISPECIES: uracil phosphoribosyltransferase [Kocuria]|uniref:uracil phosphoribosyltransferase n=1 Tax=Kocuria TaxID=57493 RepID=UPI00066085F1|nr:MULTISPECIES: uracil phosphoribosyltransferase [Kocuria]MCT1368110.1 uracil phosphoribosyltransferase [Rothia sp. p3-SID1597]RUQ23177.1 uracil phosphoribosyltransferase [Kocuria sp. HSID16901]